MAISGGSTEIAKELIKSGECDLSAVDKQGNSIFTYYMNDVDMLDFLFSHGADTILYAKKLEKINGDDTLELICDGSIYASDEGRCLSGAINKVLSVLEGLMPSEEKKEVGNKEYNVCSVLFNEAVFLDNFVEKHKYTWANYTWANFEHFQKAQVVRKAFYNLLKGDDEGFTEVFDYCKLQGISDNLLNESKYKATFKQELKYIDISYFFENFLEKIDKNLNAKISGYSSEEEGCCS